MHYVMDITLFLSIMFFKLLVLLLQYMKFIYISNLDLIVLVKKNVFVTSFIESFLYQFAKQ